MSEFFAKYPPLKPENPIVNIPFFLHNFTALMIFFEFPDELTKIKRSFFSARYSSCSEKI